MKRVLRESNLPNIAAVSAENPLGLSLPSWKVVKYVKDACSVGFVKVKPERDEEQASAAEEALTNDVVSPVNDKLTTFIQKALCLGTPILQNTQFYYIADPVRDFQKRFNEGPFKVSVCETEME